MKKRVPGWIGRESRIAAVVTWVWRLIVGVWGLVSRVWEWARGFVEAHAVALSVVPLIVGLALGGVHWESLTGSQSGTDPVSESSSATVRNLGLVLAGLVALPLAVWRGKSADRQAGTAEADLRNKRYQESAAMLGNKVLSVRLAGIYALERLATDHPEQYHIEIMKLLCAFVRDPTRDKKEADRRKIRVDVQAAMEAICACHARQSRLEKEAGLRLDLRGANLTEAILRDSDLSAAILGTFDFDPRDHGPSSILKGADLRWAILTNAHLYGVDLTDADLQGANLTGAKLMGANISGTVFSSRIRIEGTRDPKAVGLTQKQLNSAVCEHDNLPILDGLFEPNAKPPVRLEPPRFDPNGDPHPGSDDDGDD